MKYMNLLIIAFSLLFSGCSEKIVDGSKLSQSTITHIQNLGILDKEESILYFYTSFNNKASGNFVTKSELHHIGKIILQKTIILGLLIMMK